MEVHEHSLLTNVRFGREAGPQFLVQLPADLRATFSRAEGDPWVPCRVDLAITFDEDVGRFVCSEVHCAREDGGEPVTGDTLRRLPIQHMVREVVDAAMWIGTPRSAGAMNYPEGVGPLDEPSEGEDYFEMGHFGKSQREAAAEGPVDSTLRQVAASYLVAYACGLPPGATIAAEFGIPRSTAGRWIAKAREKQFLGPAEPGKAGEVR